MPIHLQTERIGLMYVLIINDVFWTRFGCGAYN